MSTAELLKQRNRKTIWLIEQVDDRGNVEAVLCAPDTPGALPFVIVRVHGDQIGREAMQALLGEDEYVLFANWYAKEGADALNSSKAQTAKTTDPKPFDDAMPPSEDFSAHMLALSKVMQRAVLREGMVEPTYAEMGGALGLYEGPLHTAIRTFGRELARPSSDTFSGSFVPP